MTNYAKKYLIPSNFYFCCILLFICWVAGLFIGSSLLEPSHISLMRSSVFQPVSIVGLFVCIFLPLICSYISFLVDKPIIILMVCFLKAVAFGFSGAFVLLLFQTAGWMVRFLLLFSDCCFTFVLFVLWLRRFSNSYIVGMSDVSVCAAIGLGIATVDYFIISPFLLGLF